MMGPSGGAGPPDWEAAASQQTSEAHRRRRSSGTSAVLEAMGEPSPMRGDDSIAALEALGGGDQRAALSFSSPREEEVRTGSTTAE